MTTNKISADISVQQTAFRKAFVQMGEASETSAKRGEILKRHTEGMLKFENGLVAVLDTVKGMVAEHLAASPRPTPPAGVKRADDPACVKWDATFKRGFHNPVVQINGALDAAKVGKRLRLSNDGVAELKDHDGATAPATLKSFKALLARLPFTSDNLLAVNAAIGEWEKAGMAAKAQQSLPLDTPAAPVANVVGVESASLTAEAAANPVAGLTPEMLAAIVAAVKAAA